MHIESSVDKMRAMTMPKFLEITAYWGNGDAESTIKLSEKKWNEIQNGAIYRITGKSYYEGESLDVTWSFGNGNVDIEDEEGRQCLIDTSIDDLIVDK